MSHQETPRPKLPLQPGELEVDEIEPATGGGVTTQSNCTCGPDATGGGGSFAFDP